MDEGKGSNHGHNRRELRARLDALDEAIHAHEGLRLVQRLDEVDRVYDWLTENAEDLMKFVRLDVDSTFGFAVLVEGHGGDTYDPHAREVGRLLHNYVASAITVRDHYRKFIKTEPKDFYREFAAFGQSFATIPVVAFTEGLRNFLLHQRVMNFDLEYRLRVAGPQFEWYLRCDHLLHLNREWNVVAREFIRRNEPRIEIGQLVDDFLRHTGSFQNWVRTRAENVYYPTLKEFEHSAVEIRSLMDALEDHDLAPLGEDGMPGFRDPDPVVPPDLREATYPPEHFDAKFRA